MKKMIGVLFSIGLMFVVTGSAFALKGDVTGGAKAEEEILHGLAVDLETISIDVESNGCTTEDDFLFLVSRHRKSPPEVTVIRINPDFCKGFSRNVTLVFSRKAVGLGDIDTFTIKNLFRGFPRF